MNAHDFARQLLAGPDLPIAFLSSFLGDQEISPPKTSVIRITARDGGVLSCVLIEPEEEEEDTAGEDFEPIDAI